MVGHDAARALCVHRAQLDAYGEFELQKLEEVLRREDDLAVIVVARAIRDADRLDRPPTATIWRSCALIMRRSAQRLERGMLFGKRRRDKHQAA